MGSQSVARIRRQPVVSLRTDPKQAALAGSDGGMAVRLSATELMALLDGINDANRGRCKGCNVPRPRSAGPLN